MDELRSGETKKPRARGVRPKKIGATPKRLAGGPELMDDHEIDRLFWEIDREDRYRDLLWSVLIQAVVDAAFGPTAGIGVPGQYAKGETPEEIQAEARRWFAERGTAPFGWSWIRDHLGIGEGSARAFERVASGELRLKIKPRILLLRKRPAPDGVRVALSKAQLAECRKHRAQGSVESEEDPRSAEVQYVRPTGRPRGRGRAAA